VTRHGGSDDQRAGLSLLEVVTNSLSAVEDTSQIGVNDLLPVLNAGVKDTSVGSTASVGDHDIDLAKVLDDVVNQLLHIGVVVDVALVGDALDAIFLRDLLCVLLAAGRTGGVGDGDVGTKLGAATSGLSANASGAGSTGDNDDLALQAEEVMKAKEPSASGFRNC
jgi:hypothetical protein